MTSRIEIFFAKILAIEHNLRYSGFESNGKIGELSWKLFRAYSIHYYKPKFKFEIEQVEVNAYLNNLYKIIKDSRGLIPEPWAESIISEILLEISLILYSYKYGKV